MSGPTLVEQYQKLDIECSKLADDMLDLEEDTDSKGEWAEVKKKYNIAVQKRNILREAMTEKQRDAVGDIWEV